MTIELGDHDALANCPLCGGDAQRYENETGSWGTPNYNRWPAIQCNECGLTLGVGKAYLYAEDLQAAWNRRPE